MKIETSLQDDEKKETTMMKKIYKFIHNLFALNGIDERKKKNKMKWKFIERSAKL